MTERRDRSLRVSAVAASVLIRGIRPASLELESPGRPYDVTDRLQNIGGVDGSDTGGVDGSCASPWNGRAPR